MYKVIRYKHLFIDDITSYCCCCCCCSWGKWLQERPRAVAGVVAASAPDACVHCVRDDVDVGDSVAEGASPGLAEHRAILQLPDDVLHPLPDGVEVGVVLAVRVGEATFHRSFRVLRDAVVAADVLKNGHENRELTQCNNTHRPIAHAPLSRQERMVREGLLGPNARVSADSKVWKAGHQVC